MAREKKILERNSGCLALLASQGSIWGDLGQFSNYCFLNLKQFSIIREQYILPAHIQSNTMPPFRTCSYGNNAVVEGSSPPAPALANHPLWDWWLKLQRAKSIARVPTETPHFTSSLLAYSLEPPVDLPHHNPLLSNPSSPLRWSSDDHWCITDLRCCCASNSNCTAVYLTVNLTQSRHLSLFYWNRQYVTSAPGRLSVTPKEMTI